MTRACREAEQAFRSGQAGVDPEHRARCAVCSAEGAALPELVKLASALDLEGPTEERAATLRAGILAEVEAGRGETRRLPRRVVWAVASVAAAVVSLVWLLPRRDAEFVHATVNTELARGVEHWPGAPGRPEVVRVESGRIRLDVSPLGANERFLVKTLDAEVEVRGTSFDVVADAGQLLAVEVRTGVVEVRPTGIAPILLRANERWARQESPPATVAAAAPAVDEAQPRTENAALAPEPQDPPARPTAPSPAQNRPSRRTGAERESKGERDFRDAWAEFARGRMAQAVALFDRAILESPGESFVEDARYGRALALARSGEHRAAIREMRRFVEDYPGSARADEVSVALGWLLLESGNAQQARPHFERGRSSSIDRLRRSAERGLDEARER